MMCGVFRNDHLALNKTHFSNIRTGNSRPYWSHLILISLLRMQASTPLPADMQLAGVLHVKVARM